MVTGDYQHTAIAVARGTGMLPPDGQLVIIQARSELHSTSDSPGRSPLACESRNRYSLNSSPVSSTRSLSGPGSRDPSFNHLSDSRLRRSPGSASKLASFKVSLFGLKSASLPPQRLSRIHPAGQSRSDLIATSAPNDLSTFAPQQQSSATDLSLCQTQPDVQRFAQSPPDRANSQRVPQLQNWSCESLVFRLQSEDHVEELDAQHAITSLAQVN